jgi:hypothetical protein
MATPAAKNPRSLKRTLIKLALVVAAVTIFVVLQRAWPRSQTLHVTLGDAAARVTELRIRFAPADDAKDESKAHFVRFSYQGNAPRIVTDEPRLRDGDYVIEVEVYAGGQEVIVRRRAKLEGAITSIDVSRDVPQ